MNESERAENPIAEAVRGYMRDRSYLLTKREGANASWSGFVDFSRSINNEIAEIDRNVFRLVDRWMPLPPHGRNDEHE